MSNTLHVARREFLAHVRSRGFLITALGTPLLLVVLWLASGVISIGEAPGREDEAPAPAAETVAPLPDGIVDQTGLLGEIVLPPELRLYAGESQAAEALRRGNIGAYIVVPADYRDTGTLRRVSRGLPDSQPQTGLVQSVLVTALLQDQSPQIAARLAMPIAPGGLEAAELTASGDGAPRQDPGFMPLLFATAIMVPLFTGGGWLLRSLAEEKESRIMEVLLVSVRPVQLLMGKLLGIGALIALQYVAWLAVFGGLASVSSASPVALLSGLSLGTAQLGVIILFALGGFVLYSALMAGLGALAPDVHSSQSLVFVISLPMMIPYYLWMNITGDPAGAVALMLSLFPFSAPLAMLLRMAVTTVPGWQLALSLGLIVLTALGTVRLMSRLFRAQVLLSGEPLSWRRMLQALTE